MKSVKKKQKIAVLKSGPNAALTRAGGDALDKFLKMMDDPDDWRTIPTGDAGVPTKLTSEELQIITRIQQAEYADLSYDPYEPYVDFFTGKVMTMPLSAAPEPKRRFLPSKWEAIKVRKILKAIRGGFIKLSNEDTVNDQEGQESLLSKSAYDMWVGETDRSILARQARHIEAPKVRLPQHQESYNPPEEYLMTEEEKAEWEAMDAEDRPHNFIPQKYKALRHVPGYERVVNERFSRCLDLFLCPRGIKQVIKMNPDDLLPVLPDPRELRPFPTSRSIDFIGHTDVIISITIDPTGQWLLSASKDGQVKLWDSQTGHCRRTWNFESSTITCLSWNPNKNLFMFAITVDKEVLLIVPPEMPASETTITAVEEMTVTITGENKSALKWKNDNLGKVEGMIYRIEHTARPSKVQWHRRGDYFVTLTPDAPTGSHAMCIHQLARRQSQHPFNKMPGVGRSILFHPTQPQLILATSKAVRIYDLVKRTMVKRLTVSSNSISDVTIHPSGDHIIVISHDSKLFWFDLDYSIRPYKTMFHNQGAIRGVSIHPTFPLLASGGDDGIIQVVHATVYGDLSTNPLIVPVKNIKDWSTSGVSITQVVFHPTQPWLFAASSAGQLALFV